MIPYKLLRLISDEVYWKYWTLDVEVDQWYSYATHPPKSTTRQEQRYYQRHFCAAYSRFKRYESHLLSTHPELLI